MSVPKISLNMLEKLGALSKGGIQHRKYAQQHRQNPSGLLGKNPTPKQIDDELLQELVEEQYVHDRLAGGMFSHQDPGMLELGLSHLDETDIFLKKLVQAIMGSGGAIRMPQMGKIPQANQKLFDQMARRSAGNA